jgi:cold shock CspA family protein
MADSWGKKEREKKKQQNKKEKAEKKLERKDLKGGSNLEDMMAYLDEFGNIVSAPPDPTRKLEINAEDIEISSPRKIESDEIVTYEGKVSFFNSTKGFGFIREISGQDSYFVHINDVKGQIKENDKVRFQLERGQKGLQAVRVEIVA